MNTDQTEVKAKAKATTDYTDDTDKANGLEARKTRARIRPDGKARIDLSCAGTG